jgi:hypothetical protein
MAAQPTSNMDIFKVVLLGNSGVGKVRCPAKAGAIGALAASSTLTKPVRSCPAVSHPE